MSQPLSHYLKTYRNKSGLSQSELAFLLGRKSGSQVTRHERGHRTPSLETALAYRAVFGTPMTELFRGQYEAVELRTIDRKQILIRQLARKAERDPGAAYKMAWLKASLQGDPWRNHYEGEEA